MRGVSRGVRRNEVGGVGVRRESGSELGGLGIR